MYNGQALTQAQLQAIFPEHFNGRRHDRAPDYNSNRSQSRIRRWFLNQVPNRQPNPLVPNGPAVPPPGHPPQGGGQHGNGGGGGGGAPPPPVGAIQQNRGIPPPPPPPPVYQGGEYNYRWHFQPPVFPAEPVVPHDPEVEFPYEDMLRVPFFGWNIMRVNRKASLPRSILCHMAKAHSSMVVHVVTLLQVDAVIKNDLVLQAWLDIVLNTGYHEYVKRRHDIMCWFFASQSKWSSQLESITLANSEFAENRKKSSRNVNQLTPVRTKQTMVLYGMATLGTLAGAWYARNKAIAAKKGIVDTWNQTLSRVYPQHSLGFGDWGIVAEEVLKSIPGGLDLLIKLETIGYGDNRTEKWHRKSMQWSFTDRVRLHRELNERNAKIVETYRQRTIGYAELYFTHQVRKKCEDLGIPYCAPPNTSARGLQTKIDLYSQHGYHADRTGGGRWDTRRESRIGAILGRITPRPWYKFSEALSTKHILPYQHSWHDRNRYRYQIEKFYPQHNLSVSLGIWFQEVLKCIPLFWFIFACVDRLMHGDWRTFNWHRKSTAWPLKKRVEEMRGIVTEKPTLVKEYSDYVQGGPLHFTETVQPYYKAELPPFTVPKKEGGASSPYYATQENQTHRKDFKETYQGFFAIMYNVSSMVKPAPSWDNMEASLHERILLLPNSVPNPMMVQTCFDLAMKVQIEHIENPKFYDDLRPEQKRRLQSVQEDINKGVDKKKLTLNIKADETINGKEKMIARVLFDCSGEPFYYLGKITSELAKGLSKIFWNKTGEHAIMWQGTLLHMFFTCGATSDDLNLFINKAKQAQRESGSWSWAMTLSHAIVTMGGPLRVTSQSSTEHRACQ